MKTGMVGLGAMGAPMARNLNRAGYLAVIWNRSAHKATDLGAELAVPVAEDLLQLARQCDLIITSVSADNDLLNVIDLLMQAVAPGTIVVDTSTTNPNTAQTAAQRLSSVQADFLDAPVSGGVEGARQGTLAMMIGGDEETLAQVRPVLESISACINHMGPVGNGQATKAVNQIMAAGINQAVSEALAFAQAQNLPMDKVIEVIGAGAASNWFLHHRGPTMVQGKFEPGFKLELHHKDLQICKNVAAEFGVALPIVEMTLIHYQRLIQTGFGEEDISALFREKRALFEPEQKTSD